MTRDEFKFLRDVPNKLISGDITFSPTVTDPDILKFEREIIVPGFTNMKVIVNGTFKRAIPALSVNFRIQGVGPVCRYDINGTLHEDADTKVKTRTHKHDLQTEKCPGNNLPSAKNRTDFTFSPDSVEDMWGRICNEASITHDGSLIV